jgi:integrase/recombinase XerD
MQHRGLASNTIVTRLQALHAMAKVLDGGRDWLWMRRIEARVHAGHVPARSKRDRLVGSADLLELGVRLMDGASALTTDRLRAMQFRDGLIIAFLAARPLRLRNLAGLELERTLVARGDGWWIDIPGDETKTGQPIDVPWPEALNLALTTYLALYRPILCRLRNRWTRPVGNALWVSTHGSPMGYFALADTIEKRTATAFGRSVNPNLFRDCAATSIAIEDPAHVRVASQILGHSSVITTERYYNQAQAIEAARQYQGFLIGLRSGRMVDDPEPTES